MKCPLRMQSAAVHAPCSRRYCHEIIPPMAFTAYGVSSRGFNYCIPTWSPPLPSFRFAPAPPLGRRPGPSPWPRTSPRPHRRQELRPGPRPWRMSHFPWNFGSGPMSDHTRPERSQQAMLGRANGTEGHSWPWAHDARRCEGPGAGLTKRHGRRCTREPSQVAAQPLWSASACLASS